MTKLLLKISLVAMLFIAQVSTAQINLLHTFDGDLNFNYDIISEPSAFPDNCYYFENINWNGDRSYTIKIYNSDFSLNTQKTYHFTPPAGYVLTWVDTSKKFFNSDNNYEFLATFLKEEPHEFGDNTNTKVILYDESGSVLMDFGMGYRINKPSYLHIVNGQYRFAMQIEKYENDRYQIQTKIYSVEGSGLTNIQESNSSLRAALPYPNPAKTTINLPYTLKQGEFGVMKIFNMKGQLIEQKQIGFDFDKILLNVTDYTKGIYFYEVNGVSNKFIVK